jgi:hypothetical protein
MRLIPVFHVVAGEMIKAVEKRGPGVIGRQEYYHFADFLDIDIFSGKPEVFGQPYGLASSIREYLCRLHDNSPFSMIYTKVYITSRAMSKSVGRACNADLR